MKSTAFALLLMLAFVLCYLRLFFGVDFIDEGFNVALPYRFALGDKPFVDEMALSQGAALIIAPLVKLYLLARGGTDGLVLFSRHLFLLMNSLVALFFFRTARQRGVSVPIAAVAAMIYVCFIPFGIPNISYNTLGCSAFFAGLLFAMNARAQIRSSSDLLAGLAHGVALLAYPPMGLVVVPFAVWHSYLSPNHRARAFLLYTSAVILGGCLIIGAYGVTPFDLLSFATSLRNTGDTGDGHLGFGLAKAGEAAIAFLKLFSSPGAIFFLSSTGVAIFAAKKSAVARFVPVPVLLGLSVLFWKSRASTGGLGVHGYLIAFSALAPILARSLVDRNQARLWLLSVWLPSLALGIVMGWASANGLLASAVGIAPAAVVAAVFLGEWLSEISARTPALSFTPALTSALVLGSMLYFGSKTFSDGNVGQLRARVTRGPYRGLFTGPNEKRISTEALHDDIDKASRGEGRTLVFPHLPGAYLSSRQRPAGLSIWDACQSATESECREHFLKTRRGGLLVVSIKQKEAARRVAINTDDPSLCLRETDRPGYTLFDCGDARRAAR